MRLALDLTLPTRAALGGAGSHSGPDAPVLTLTSGTSVNTPTFNIAFTDLVPAGSVLSFQSATNSGFTTGVVTTNHTVTAPESAANAVALGLAALANGTYWFRCNITVGTTSPWSNSQTETINAPAVLTSPAGSNTGQTTASLSVSTNQSGGTLYWVVSTSATPPSAAQILLGEDSSGSTSAAHGNQVVSASGSQTAGATGLTAGTTYYAYFMHQNLGALNSNVAAASSFNTQASNTYTFIGDDPTAASGTAHSKTFAGLGTSPIFIIVGGTCQGAKAVGTVTVDGQTLTQDVFDTSLASAGLWSGFVTPTSGVVTINWVSAGFEQRTMFVWTVPVSLTKQATAQGKGSGTPQSVPISVNAGDTLFAVAFSLVAADFVNSTPVGPSSQRQLLPAGNSGASADWSNSITTTATYHIAAQTGATQNFNFAVATYR